MKTKLILALLKPATFLLVFCTLHSPLCTWAQGTAFSYQGRLNDGGGPANGTYDFAFTIWTAAMGPSQVGTTFTTNGVAVSSGLFAVTIDFGSGIFTGEDRWLQVGVRTNGAATFVTLTPREKVTAVPYAITAGNLTGVVSNSSISGTYSSAVTFNNAANQFAGSFVGNGSALSNVNAQTLGGLPPSSFWTLNGNSVAPGQFLGSTNNRPVEIRVNGQRALRLEPTLGGAPNIIGGADANQVDAGVAGATISGGGPTNRVSVDFGTVGGGFANLVHGYGSVIAGGDHNEIRTNANRSVIGGGFRNMIMDSAAFGGFSTIAGGRENNVTGGSAFIGGGALNSASNNYSSVVGGFLNVASSFASAIGGGYQNTNLPRTEYSVIGGGSLNLIQNDAQHSVIVGGNRGTILAGARESFIGGGLLNTIRAVLSFVGGGDGNTNASPFSVIGGGSRNFIDPNSGPATVAGGSWNSINNAPGAAIVGGSSNTNRGGDSFIGGGNLNRVENSAAVVVGGMDNGNAAIGAFIGGGEQNVISISAGYATITGGLRNTSQASLSALGGGIENWIDQSSDWATIAGGYRNVIASNSPAATVGGGRSNQAYNEAATVPGGAFNSAIKDYSFAAGFRAKAYHRGSFVWADSLNADFTSTADDQFNIRAAGGVRLSDSTPSVSFGATTRQMLNLWSTNYGIGVQASSLYFRCNNASDLDGFIWYKGGGHADGYADPGGGTELMHLVRSGLYVNGTFVSMSDRNAKTNFATLDTREVLEKVIALPLSRWSYKNDANTTHVGPMAQDFHGAFNVGTDDKHIATVDADGVALAAIQGLNQKLEEKDAKISALEKRLSDLEKAIAQLTLTQK
jgi:hypothetical protein